MLNFSLPPTFANPWISNNNFSNPQQSLQFLNTHNIHTHIGQPCTCRSPTIKFINCHL